MQTPILDTSEQTLVPFDQMLASTFEGFYQLSEAMPAETQVWLLAAVNQIRMRGVGVPALTMDELWAGIFDAVDSASAVIGEPETDRMCVARRRAETAAMLTLFCRVFGLGFTPATTLES
jgi:hypothetical protein